MQGSRISTVILLALAALLAGCGEARERGEPGEPPGTSAPPPADSLTATQAQRVAMLWSQNCALCHVDGTGGAPRLGNADEWRPRLAQGTDVLLQHTLEGFNNMPPLGYCMGCEREDFVALIGFMTGTGG